VSRPGIEAKAPSCTQWWSGDDGLLHLCGLLPGHAPECRCTCGRAYSETVEEQ
jgi:hypothetical protein